MVSWSKETLKWHPSHVTVPLCGGRQCKENQVKFDGTECDASDEMILLNGVVEIRALEIAKFSEL
jgi:hypothetical protein